MWEVSAESNAVTTCHTTTRPPNRELTWYPFAVMVSVMAACGCAAAASGWTGDSETAPPAVRQSARKRPLPPPVTVRSDPDGVTLADPAFKPLPGARADFGRLGGAVYQRSEEHTSELQSRLHLV